MFSDIEAPLLPETIVGYVFRYSGKHQIALAAYEQRSLR
jgi:hypothetical protein